MKKTAALVNIIITSVFIIATASPASALSISVGGYAWGAWWNPFFKKQLTEKKQYFPLIIVPVTNKFTMDPTVLAGPVISIKFNEKYTWSNTLVIGQYRASSSQIQYFQNPSSTNASLPILTPKKEKQPQMKYDLDSTHSFAMTEFMKLFIGVKYQHYSFDHMSILPVISTGSSAIFYNKSTLEYHGIGAGMGVSFNIQLIGGLHLITNISALAQYPLMLDRQPKSTNFVFIRTIYNEIYYLPTGRDTMIDGYYQIGGNAAVSLAYYIEKASLTLALGGRYQYLRMFGKEKPNGDYVFADQNDHFYGATFSVTYTFNISDKKEKEKDG